MATINGIEIDVTIVQARGIVGKDSGGLFSKKKSSDPYAIIYWGGEKCGRTKTISKNLSPVWNETFKIKASSDHMQQLLHGDPKYSVIDIVIFDDDKLNKDDALGTVSLPLNFNDDPTNLPSSWYTLGKGKAPYVAKDVSGELEMALFVSVETIISKEMNIGDTMELNNMLYDQKLTVDIGWFVPTGTKAKKVEKIAPHASAICFDSSLNLMDIASFKDPKTRDEAIKHCGTGKSWFSEIGKNDEEKIDDMGENINIELDKINPSVTYICFVVNSFKARDLDLLSKYDFILYDPKTKNDIAKCTYSKPTVLGRHSALLMFCLYRDQFTRSWMLRTVAEVVPGLMTNDVVDVLQDMIHQKISFSHPPPYRHSEGPRAELVIEY